MPADDLRPIVAALEPKAWRSDRAALLQALQKARLPEHAETVWLTDDLQDNSGRDSGESAYPLAEWMMQLGPVTMMTPPAGSRPGTPPPPAHKAPGGSRPVRPPPTH